MCSEAKVQAIYLLDISSLFFRKNINNLCLFFSNCGFPTFELVSSLFDASETVAFNASKFDSQSDFF